MTNVYNKTVFERNSIQLVPTGYIDDNANDLFRFMGSFWKNLHEGTSLIKGLQKIRGVKLAQFYLDLLETLKLQDRKGAPVFHRELWKPLILKKSTRNKSQENILKVGEAIVLGKQPAGSKYGEGTELQIGSLANLDKYVTYPVEGDITDIVSGVSNNVINPTVFYKIGTEFPSSDIVYMNGTLIFPIEKDPFREGSEFEIYDTVEDVQDESTNDQETVLWASDVLIDKDYVANHMAYALGINCPSSDITKRIINAGWDTINCGLTPELLRTLLAAMLNIPVIQEEIEQILTIDALSDGTKRVTTDFHTYTIFKNAELRSCIRKGTKLTRGEFIDEAVKIYPLLTDVDEAKLKGITEYADILKEDVPVISLPKSIIRTKTANGLAVDWNPADVIDTFEVDANGHRKLYFHISGAEADVTAFWKDVWEHAEAMNVNIEDLLLECEPDPGSSSSSDSDDTWRVIPAKFFLQYMVGGNTLIVTLAKNQVEDISLIHDSMYFDLLNKVIPAGMRLFFVEHTTIDDDVDTYNVGPDVSGRADTEEQVDKYVYDEIEDEFDYKDLPGIRGKRIPTYYDQIEMKLFRNRKRNAE